MRKSHHLFICMYVCMGDYVSTMCMYVCRWRVWEYNVYVCVWEGMGDKKVVQLNMTKYLEFVQT